MIEDPDPVGTRSESTKLNAALLCAPASRFFSLPLRRRPRPLNRA